LIHIKFNDMTDCTDDENDRFYFNQCTVV